MLEAVSSFGSGLLFLGQGLGLGFRYGVRRKDFIDQLYQTGVKSVAITVAAGLFVGMILAIQINLQLKDFGAQSFLGGLSTSTSLRNLGPVLIAFLLSGKVGAFTSAELGSMKITDQISAIRCLGMDPIRYIVVPRLWAVTCASFLLLILGLGLTLLGGALISSLWLSVNPLLYLSQIPRFVTLSSLLLGLAKSFVFGLSIAAIACYQGYHVEGGAQGVGRAVRRASVLSLVSIIILDFTVSLLFGLTQTALGL